MTQRHAHLVGSMPYKDEKSAMEKALRYLGPRLLSLPDGEIGRKSERHSHGERLGWIQWVIERFEKSPAFEMVKKPRYDPINGLWADYESGVRYRLKVPRRSLYRNLDFGYIDYFKMGYGAFKKMQKEHRRNDLLYQFGIPGALAISVFSLGLLQGIRTRKIFEDRLAHEVNAINRISDGNILFQIEVPIELGVYLKAPRLLKSLTARWAVRSIISLVNKMDRNARIGVHLCLGDLNNRPFSLIGDAGPLVDFANRIAAIWPLDRKLEFVHFPLAMGNIPPSTRAGFYEPFRRLALPAGTRIIAGFIHEGLNDQDHRYILKMIEKAAGRSVDVSSSCGFGRRTAETTELLLKKTALLAG
ncbi:MAG: hypothetical protein KA369_17135 [Spirochaetes bacterium]|nr:hypothetical protein [Spirochaetota bacterium]